MAAYCLCTSRLNTHKHYIQPTQYIYVLLKFPNQQLVFIRTALIVSYSAELVQFDVSTEHLNTIEVNFGLQ